MEKTHNQLDGDDEDPPPNRLTELMDYYPDNLVVQYAMAPCARHFFK